MKKHPSELLTCRAWHNPIVFEWDKNVKVRTHLELNFELTHIVFFVSSCSPQLIP